MLSTPILPHSRCGLYGVLPAEHKYAMPPLLWSSTTIRSSLLATGKSLSPLRPIPPKLHQRSASALLNGSLKCFLSSTYKVATWSWVCIRWAVPELHTEKSKMHLLASSAENTLPSTISPTTCWHVKSTCESSTTYRSPLQTKTSISCVRPSSCTQMEEGRENKSARQVMRWAWC